MEEKPQVLNAVDKPEKAVEAKRPKLVKQTKASKVFKTIPFT